MSLHRGKGGAKQSKFIEPTQREGLALAVGAAMQWSKLRDSSNPMFFKSIAEAVKRCEGTERDWRDEDIKFFVQQRVFGGIPQYAVEAWIQREFRGVKGAEIQVKRADVVQNFMYKYLATIDAGVDYESARELAVKANITELLQCREMGGCTQWTLDEFLLGEPWDELGGKAGLKAQSKKLLTLVAAAGRKFNGQPAPIDPVCKVCGELKFMHMGDRCKLDPIPCKCDVQSAEDMKSPQTAENGKKGVKRTRGFDQARAPYPMLLLPQPSLRAPCYVCVCVIGS